MLYVKVMQQVAEYTALINVVNGSKGNFNLVKVKNPAKVPCLDIVEDSGGISLSVDCPPCAGDTLGLFAWENNAWTTAEPKIPNNYQTRIDGGGCSYRFSSALVTFGVNSSLDFFNSTVFFDGSVTMKDRSVFYQDKSASITVAGTLSMTPTSELQIHFEDDLASATPMHVGMLKRAGTISVFLGPEMQLSADSWLIYADKGVTGVWDQINTFDDAKNPCVFFVDYPESGIALSPQGCAASSLPTTPSLTPTPSPKPPKVTPTPTPSASATLPATQPSKKKPSSPSPTTIEKTPEPVEDHKFMIILGSVAAVIVAIAFIFFIVLIVKRSRERKNDEHDLGAATGDESARLINEK